MLKISGLIHDCVACARHPGIVAGGKAQDPQGANLYCQALDCIAFFLALLCVLSGLAVASAKNRPGYIQIAVNRSLDLLTNAAERPRELSHGISAVRVKSLWTECECSRGKAERNMAAGVTHLIHKVVNGESRVAH